jgi:hypothetical protein
METPVEETKKLDTRVAEEALKNGEQREETRGTFLRRAAGEGYAVFEGKTAAYGYRAVEGQSATQNARQIQQEVKNLSGDSSIIDGTVLLNQNGIAVSRDVPQAVTAEHSRIFINNNATLSPKNIAGHESFHLWKGKEGREAFIETVEDNLDFTSKAFLNYQSAVAQVYLGGEADLSDSGQVESLREELFAYISGDIHEGVNDDALRPMFRDYDAVKAAWNDLAQGQAAGEQEPHFSRKVSSLEDLQEENRSLREKLEEMKSAQAEAKKASASCTVEQAILLLYRAAKG